MIWTDPNTGRRWNVRQIGRIGGPIVVESSEAADAADQAEPAGAIVLTFESLDAGNESRVVTGAPEDWSERPDVVGQLFAEANRQKPGRGDSPADGAPKWPST